MAVLDIANKLKLVAIGRADRHKRPGRAGPVSVIITFRFSHHSAFVTDRVSFTRWRRVEMSVTKS
jgi:hypothetical protein